MAIPTITDITPSTVAPLAKPLLKLDGTGFNVWPTPVPNAGMVATIDGEDTTIQVCDDTLAFISCTEYINKKKIPYDAQTVNFNVGQILKGAKSGAKGLISADVNAGTTGVLTLQGMSGTFIDDEPIMDALGGSATANIGANDDAVTVRVANIDAVGDEVVGENASTTITFVKNAIIYPDASPHLQQVLAAFVHRLTANYKIPITTAADVDWTESGQLVRTIANPPGIALTDFDLERMRDAEPETMVVAERIYRDTLCFRLGGVFLIGCRTTGEALRYIVSLMQFQRRTPYFIVDGVKIKFKIDPRAEIAFNVGEGIKSWTLGYTLEPIVIECPEEIELAFKALSWEVETAGKAI